MNDTVVREQRRFRRFELRLPLEVTRAGTRRMSRSGETKNLSSGGVLFTTRSHIEVGDPIEYSITLPSGLGGDAGVRLRCKGKVVRLEQPKDAPVSSGSPIGVAATLERYEFVRQETHRSFIQA